MKNIKVKEDVKYIDDSDVKIAIQFSIVIIIYLICIVYVLYGFDMMPFVNASKVDNCGGTVDYDGVAKTEKAIRGTRNPKLNHNGIPNYDFGKTPIEKLMNYHKFPFQNVEDISFLSKHIGTFEKIGSAILVVVIGLLFVRF